MRSNNSKTESYLTQKKYLSNPKSFMKNNNNKVGILLANA
jgi:hypothetical protein